jgi:hypothetical protein
MLYTLGDSTDWRDRMSQLYDLLWSAFALVTFWAVGATIFSQIEGWTWGYVTKQSCTPAADIPQ